MMSQFMAVAAFLGLLANLVTLWVASRGWFRGVGRADVGAFSLLFLGYLYGFVLMAVVALVPVFRAFEGGLLMSFTYANAVAGVSIAPLFVLWHRLFYSDDWNVISDRVFSIVSVWLFGLILVVTCIAGISDHYAVVEFWVALIGGPPF